MSFALNRSSALQHFKLGNTIEKMMELNRLERSHTVSVGSITLHNAYSIHNTPVQVCLTPHTHTPLQTSFRAT